MALAKSFRDLNVYQGPAQRKSRAAFTEKINQALGETMETQAWLDHALQSNYLDQTEHSRQDQTWRRIGGMLHRMIERADDNPPPTRRLAHQAIESQGRFR